jgi:DNA-directed RNA polymerase specialized sigma24 family protein
LALGGRVVSCNGFSLKVVDKQNGVSEMTDERVQTEQDELILKLWDGDESAKGELVLLCAGRVEAGIQREFPALTEVEVEDVVAEAIKRFWKWRESYDPEAATLQTVIYGIAANVASEFRSGRYKWQKIRLRQVEDPVGLFDRTRYADAPDAAESDPKPPELQDALLVEVRAVFESLPALQQDILRAYADAEASEFELDAGDLGKELGIKHQDGVPIPAVTIRVYKLRAKAAIEKKLARAGHDLKAKGYTDD